MHLHYYSKKPSYYRKKPSSSGGRGLGVLGVLQIIFIVLKVLKLIDWSWGVVFIPLYISCAGLVIVLIICAVAYCKITGRKIWKKK